MPQRDSRLLATWAREGLIHASTIEDVLPSSTPEWIKQTLLAHSYPPYIYWLKDLSMSEREAIEKAEDARAYRSTDAAGASPVSPPEAVKPAASPAPHPGTSEAQSELQRGEIVATTSKPSAGDNLTRPGSLDAEQRAKPENAAPQAARGTPTQRTPAVVQKTWERLHFSPYAAQNMQKALVKVFAAFEDRSFLMPNATAQEAPQSAPEGYVAIADALPETEWQDLLKITAAMKSGGETRSYSRRRY